MGIEQRVKLFQSDVERRTADLEKITDYDLCILVNRRDKECKAKFTQRLLGYICGVACVALAYPIADVKTAVAITASGILFTGIHVNKYLPSYDEQVEYRACSKIKEKRGW